MSARTSIDPEIVDAIMRLLLTSYIGLADDYEDASEMAWGALYWSAERERLVDGFDQLANVDSDADESINDIGFKPAFRLGFDLATQLATNILASPLDVHDAPQTIDQVKAEYLKALHVHRQKLELKRQAEAAR